MNGHKAQPMRERIVHVARDALALLLPRAFYLGAHLFAIHPGLLLHSPPPFAQIATLLAYQ